MLLWPVVMDVLEIPKKEAMQLVIEALREEI